jgi:hypothetical protein
VQADDLEPVDGQPLAQERLAPSADDRDVRRPLEERPEHIDRSRGRLRVLRPRDDR